MATIQYRRFLHVICMTILVCLFLQPVTVEAAGWKKIRNELLGLQKNPYDAGSGALIVFNNGELRLFFESDIWWEMEVYRRIKVFNEEGKRYATVVIPYGEDQEVRDISTSAKVFVRISEACFFHVMDSRLKPAGMTAISSFVMYHKNLQLLLLRYLKARVILPSGKKLNMDKDKIITEPRITGLGAYAENAFGRVKKFTIPGVENGAIIEYQYVKKSGNVAVLTPWDFENEDYTLSSTFQVTVPIELQYAGNYVNMSKEPATSQQKWVDGRGTTYTWMLENLIGVKDEPFSRAAYNLRAGMQFILTGVYLRGEGNFPIYDDWEATTKYATQIYKYMGKRGQIPDVVRQLTEAVDDPEEKIAHIYDYVQRNMQHVDIRGFHLTSNYSGSILAGKQADHVDMNVLLCAMLLEAGLDADVAWIAPQDGPPFNRGFSSPVQFERLVTYVNLTEDRIVWLDPMVRGTPYGILPWQDQNVSALPTEGKGSLTRTPNTSFLNTETRSLRVQLDTEGHILGEGEISASGQNAIRYRRQYAFVDQDEQQSTLREALENQVTDVEVSDLNFSDQITAAQRVELSFAFTGKDYATVAGNRIIVNPALMERITQDFLPNIERSNPLQLGYASTVTDEVTITIPSGYVMEQLPSAVNLKSPFGRFIAMFRNTPEGIVYKRVFSITQAQASAQAYPDLRALYNRISEADQQQIVLIEKEDVIPADASPANP